MTEMTTAPKPFCFVLMPFDPKFKDVYRIGIKEACVSAGTYCERVDEQTFEERMLDRIYNQIAKADVVIADMTGQNPNVFYEVGYAHALGDIVKSCVLRNGDQAAGWRIPSVKERPSSRGMSSSWPFKRRQPF